MASVLLLEDDPVTRQRLAGIVQRAPNLELAAACADLASALERLESSPAPDVLLVDLQLPDGSGIDLIRAARRRTPHAESMVISVFGAEAPVVAAIEAGAPGYLLKDARAAEFVAALERLRAGESPISSAIARHLLKRFRSASPDSAPDSPPASLLTRRENDVLQLIAKGLPYQRIAETLDLSPHTVTSHVKQIYRKLAVNSRGEAVFEALQLGLIPPARP